VLAYFREKHQKNYTFHDDGKAQRIRSGNDKGCYRKTA